MKTQREKAKETKPGKRKGTEGESEKETELEVEDEGVADLKGSRKKGQNKKKNRMVDPFEVPPNRINFDLFQIQNPFIEVVKSDDVVRLEEDKVMDDLKMKDDALLAAMAAMVPTSMDVACSFLQPSTESGGRPIHLSMASAFKKVTRPRSTSAPTLTSIEVVKGMLQKGEATTISSARSEEEDLQISIVEKDLDHTGGESTKSLEVSHEGDAGEFKMNSTKFDICFRVYDKGIMSMDKRITKLIVDCKWEDVSLQAICQVAMYGLREAVQNMGKGRLSPIYLEIWGESMWRYAILFPQGTVFVQDGEVQASVESRSGFKGLQSTFTKKKAKLKIEYKDAFYPDGSYVLGALFVSVKKFNLPNFMGIGSGNHFDTKLFYESKIRILVGDRALQWTKEDVEGILALRQEQLRKQTANFFGGC